MVGRARNGRDRARPRRPRPRDRRRVTRRGRSPTACCGEVGFLAVLHRERKEGLRPAYVAGFPSTRSAPAPSWWPIDQHLRHATDLPRPVRGDLPAGIALGSRYVPGGGTENQRFAASSAAAAPSTPARCSGSPCTTRPRGSKSTAARCWRRSSRRGSSRAATPSRSRPSTARSVRASASRRCRSGHGPHRGRLEDGRRDRSGGDDEVPALRLAARGKL